MKKITYKERSLFYNQEVQKDLKNIELLKTIKNKYKVSSALYCPCASGIYLCEFSKLFKESYFIDIEKNMIDFVNQQLKIKKIKNVKAFDCDMKDINTLKIKCDCIFVLDQGIQYLNYSEFKTFLDNSYFVAEYIVLDLFDFNFGKKLFYYDAKIEDNKFYFSKDFTFKGLNIKRYNYHIHYNDYIEFCYQYFNENILLFETKFKLYIYRYEELKKIVEDSNKYLVKEKFEYKNGRYIVVLKKRDITKLEN